MKNKKAVAIVSLVLAAAFTACLIMYVGSRRDPFQRRTEHRIVSVSLYGQASVLRRGTGYSLKEGVGVIETDTIITDPGAEASFRDEDTCVFILDENTEAGIILDEPGRTCLEVRYGTVFFKTSSGGGEFSVSVPTGDIVPGPETLFSVECYPGTQTLRVYRGEVSLTDADTGGVGTVRRGEQFTSLQDDDGQNTDEDIKSISVQSLSGFLIKKLLEYPEREIFTDDELRSEAERRIRETEAALAEKEAYEAQIIAQGGTVPVILSSKPVPEYMTQADLHECTVSIVCDTILGNMDELTEGKNVYVPENGVILAPSTVQFVTGETVYDVLKRACAAVDIPLEYRWTVEYGGYYIEGINELYEFDCGPESGWMYKVNGWFPNYGSSNYILKDGDIIVWAYTCRGLGEDLGLIWSP